MSGGRGRQLGGIAGVGLIGQVFGGQFPFDATSGLSMTHRDMLFRQATRGAVPPNPGFIERRIAGAVITVLANEDTYLFLNDTGTIGQTVGIANGGNKPTISSLGVNAQFLALVVSDGTDITSVQLLWLTAGADIEPLTYVATLSALQGPQDIYLPYGGQVVGLQGAVIDALAATDAGTITASVVKNAGGDTEAVQAITNGVLTFPLSSAAGVVQSAVPSAFRTFGPGDTLRLVAAKTTAGGEVQVTVVVEQ